MQYINISNIEEIFKAKAVITEYWLTNNIIQSNLELFDFIKYLKIDENIYIKESSVITFKIVKTKDEIYIIYTGDQHLFNDFTNALNKIKFDLSNLHKMSTNDMLSDDFVETEKFIIKNNYYDIK